MKTFLAFLQKLENFIMATAFVVMTLSAFAQVVNRNLVGAGISWFEELARYCMVYMALLGTEIGLRDGTQIAVTAVIDRIKGAPRDIIVIFGKIVVVLFSAVCFWTSLALIEKQIQFGQLSPGLRIPMFVPYAALPIAFLAITCVQAVAVFALIARLFGRKTPASEGGAA